jgi:predicted aspartyl protease
MRQAFRFAAGLGIGMAASLPAGAAVPIERLPARDGQPAAPDLPVVRLKIGGVTGLYLLDTGSSHTVIVPRAAERLGLAQKQAGSGRDGLGATVAALAIDPIVFADADGTPIATVTAPISIAVPPLEALGLSGVVSPQTLEAKVCIRADFASGHLAVDAVEQEAAGADHVERRPSGLARSLIRIPVTVGMADAQILVDSGAVRTTLPTQLLDGVPRLAAERRQGASGQAQTFDRAGPVTLRIGKREMTLEAVGVAPDDRGARIGFDLLSRATLLLCRNGAMALTFR